MKQNYINPKITYNSFKIYLLNYYFLFGLVFLILGLFGAIYITISYNSTRVDKDDLVKSSQGRVIEIEKIITTSGEGMGSICFRYGYSYNFNNAQIIGYGFSDKKIFKVDDSVKVYYNSENPGITFVDNLRNSQFAKDDTILSWILPLFGLLILLYSSLYSKRICILLENGIITTGKYMTTKKNEDNGFFHHYSFIDNKGRERIVRKFSRSRHLKDSETIILFDSNNKSNQITPTDLTFFGNRNIKKQLYSAANSVYNQLL